VVLPNRAVASGGQWCPAPPFEFFKMWRPLLVFGPPAAKSWRRAYCLRTFCNAHDLELQCWWKTKKININILIDIGGLERLHPLLAAPLVLMALNLSGRVCYRSCMSPDQHRPNSSLAWNRIRPSFHSTSFSWYYYYCLKPMSTERALCNCEKLSISFKISKT